MILHLLKGKIQKVLRIFRLVKTTFLKMKKISCSPATPFPQIQVCQMIMTVMMKKTDILPETFFTVTRSGTTATTYEQVVQVQRQQRTNKSFRYNGNNVRTSRLFVFIYCMACFIRILYICLFFDDLVSDMYQVTTQYLSHLQLYVFFISLIKFI